MVREGRSSGGLERRVGDSDVLWLWLGKLEASGVGEGGGGGGDLLC